MLADAENGLLEAIRSAPIGKRLREVATLPDLDADSLVKKFATDAPAVYVVAGSFRIVDGAAWPEFGLLCVSRNSRGHDAARKGDGQMIGLYEMLMAVASQIDGATIGDVNWRAAAADFMSEEALFKAGVYAGIVRIEAHGQVRLPPALDEAALTKFQTFASDYDIGNRQTAAEHKNWLLEPPEYGTSVPAPSDTLKLNQEQ